MPGLKRIPMALRLECLSEQVGDCRIWQGSCLPKGYPLVGKGGHGNGYVYAHRAAYELAYGPIPEGLEMHHTCGNARCINPEHLLAVSKAEHYEFHRASHCPKGHAFTSENTYIHTRNGGRICKQCRAVYMRDYYRKRLDREKR